MRDVALGAGDALHQTEFVELNHRFGQVEVNRTSALALAIQDHRQGAHVLEVFDLRGVPGARGLVALDHGIHGRVGHSFSGTDHAFVDLVADNLTLVIDFHGAGEHQAVHLWTQTANVGRESKRQHGDGAIGEIDACAAQARFLIEGRVASYILSDVRDVYLQFVVAALELPDVDGIVEIAGGFAVNGDDRQGAVVAAMA